MGKEKEFENGPRWSNFRLSWAPDLDLGSGHGHYLFFISHRVLPVYQISSKSKKLFVDGRMDGNLPTIVLGRLPKFGSQPKNNRKTMERIKTENKVYDIN